jgi:hypothetical protein
MAFPAKVFYSVLEVSARWDCSLTQVVNYAISDEIDLVAGFALVRLDGECAAGLLSVTGSEVRPLFRPYGKGAKKIYVTQARRAGEDQWHEITEPVGGVRLASADIMITAREIDRFEEAHGIGRTRNVGPGAPTKYDWDRFYIALIKRLYTGGVPVRQRELVIEMQEWFIANSAEGEAPDESTIRRRNQSVWKELNPN